MSRAAPLLLAALLASGCATSYQLTLMPRDSGKLYYGSAEDGGRGEGTITVTIEDRTYQGTWVEVTPTRTSGMVTGGVGIGAGGRRGGWGGVGTVTLDNPEGGSATALLQGPGGSGLRCEFRSGGYGRGGGVCREDNGREYDVQLRSKATS